jgi:hypothetical protein
VCSSISLSPFLCHPSTSCLLLPVLPQLLQTLLRLLQLIDNGQIVLTLQTLIEKFSQEIEPYAVELFK